LLCLPGGTGTAIFSVSYKAKEKRWSKSGAINT